MSGKIRSANFSITSELADSNSNQLSTHRALNFDGFICSMVPSPTCVRNSSNLWSFKFLSLKFFVNSQILKDGYKTVELMHLAPITDRSAFSIIVEHCL